jgi:uncharacterized protein (DUF849 family)
MPKRKDELKNEVEGLTVERKLTLDNSVSVDSENRKVSFIMISDDNAGTRWDWDRGHYTEVLDVDGVNHERLRVFFKDHNRSVDSAIGKIENKRVEDGQFKADVIFGTDDRSQEIFKKYEEGILTDCSVTYIRNKVLVEERETEPDLVTVTEYDIIECSAVGVGFDKGATVGRENKLNGENLMNEKLKKELEQLRSIVDGLTNDQKSRKLELENLEKESTRSTETNNSTVDTAAVAQRAIEDERQRTTEINTLVVAGELTSERAADFVANGSKIETVRKTILDEKIERSKAVVVGGVPGADAMNRAIEDAMLIRCGITVATPHESANMFRGASLLDVARAITQYNGHDKHELAQRAMSTGDFSLLLGNVANRVIADSFEEEEGTYNLWTQSGDLPDFRIQNEVGLKNPNGRLRKVQENGELKNIEFDEEGNAWKLESYGEKFTLNRQMLINDDLGVFSNIVSQFGQMSKRTANGLVYDLLQGKGDYANYLMGDGKKIFIATHNNLAGVGSALGSTSLSAGRTAIRRQKDGKTALNINPKYLIVSPENEAVAKKILTSESDVGSSNSGESNPHRNGYELIIENELDQNPWYLAATRKTIKTGTLQGTGGRPIVQMNNQSLSGTEYECIFDFGLKATDYRGLYKNAGA